MAEDVARKEMTDPRRYSARRGRGQLRLTRQNEAADAKPIATLSYGSSIAKFAANQVIFAQGTPCDATYLLHSGIAKISMLSELGREAIILVLSSGDFFGEGKLRDKFQRLATATAITECTIERIEEPAMRRALRDDPQFSRLFMENLLTQKVRLLEELAAHHFHSTEKRLARLLLRLAGIDEHEGGLATTLRISQGMLAEMVGTTRSRVNFFMNKFRRLGLIEYNGKLVVHRSLSRILRGQ